MAIDRRTVLVGCVVALGGGLASRISAAAAAGAPEQAPYASACRREDGSYAVALLDKAGRIVGELPLAGRAHDIAWHAATGVAVAFARQPGRFALAFSPAGAFPPRLFAPPDNRCFFGHGAFSPDGRLLFTTENDIDEGIGRLGVYDAKAGFARIGELTSSGIGPHELVLLGDGRTLAVANGGYETLPATGRQPIDIASMRPSLAFVDSTNGDVKAHHELPQALRALSIRHLAVDARNRVWFGGQWEGNADAMPEVIGSASLDRPLALIAPPRPLARQLKGYIGSIVASRDGTMLAASAPRTGRTVIVDAETGCPRAEISLADGCGVAALADGFIVSSGHGVLVEHHDGKADATLARLPDIAFDNHLRLLKPPA